MTQGRWLIDGTQFSAAHSGPLFRVRLVCWRLHDLRNLRHYQIHGIRMHGESMKRTTKEDFEKRFQVTPGCWLWTGYLNISGYGRLSIGGKMKLAHRASYEFYVGPIQDGLCVCHKCDNPKCVNPDHFFLGTINDNTQDMIKKGRKVSAKRPGEMHNNAKLTDAAVAEARASSLPLHVLAKKYGVSPSTMSVARNGKTWTHLV